MDRLSSMATFVRAADLGSFAAAAEATGMSPTMVGKHVQYLEARLGVRLISRTTRRQSLTEFGRVYYERCVAILEAIAAADSLAADHLNTPHGTLRVTMPALLGRFCVAPLLLRLADQYPTLRIEMSMTDRIVDLLAGGFDLAVRTGRPRDRAGLTFKLIGSHRMVVCGSPDLLAGEETPKVIADLQGWPVLMYARQGWDHGWLFRGEDERTIEIAPPSRILFDDLAAVTDAAVAGSGLAWVPIWLAQPHIERGELVEVPLDVSPFQFDNYAVWPEARHLPLRVRLTLTLLEQGLASRLEPQVG